MTTWRRVEQREHGGQQRAGGSVKIRELLVATILVFAGGLREQQVRDLVEQDQRASIASRVRAATTPPVRRFELRRRSVCALPASPYAGRRPHPTSRHLDRGVAGRNRADCRQTLERVGDLARRQPIRTARSTSRRESCYPASPSNSSSRRRGWSGVTASDNVR
jgi:hypothetical protein